MFDTSRDCNQELEKKDKGKNIKKKKNIIDKHKEVKAQFTHPWLITTLKGHSGNILDMDYSNNGKYLISCDEGGSILIIEKKFQEDQNSLKNKKKYDFELTRFHVPSKWYKKLAYSEEQLYQKMKQYILSREEQMEYGFPVENPNEPSKALILKENKFHNNNDVNPNQQICCRCETEFYLKSDGSCFAEKDCFYHWGKKKKTEIINSNCSKYLYSCCNRETNSKGCMTSKYHVSNQVTHNLDKFVKTKSLSENIENYGIFALDCEMCFTIQGLEIAKISVVQSNGEIIYNTLVLPENPVIDYNTSFSGITEDDLINVNTTLEDVHEVLLKLFNSKTILIGHGLENDLKALRLIHDTVIDTSIVFPHYYGLPYRRSLKSLISHHLHKTIQENETGHDSAEDARACMELMLWKLFKDKNKK
ncbi:RNA exonuclease 1 homolog isoform X1 [Centruroides sculpturatus]|uniref:RNA exonuclease 1 homolog isoform X1 n=2 Tax=Centruroides sculpturatus TaxID=218467 RepID=UPI000C6E2396|nr:RNA exonuclease 1 homolog isoform X1 [Centruroides sculpturatus]